MSGSFVVIVFSAVFGYVAINMVLRHAVRLGLVQTANARSSHSGNRPSGGGLGVVVTAAIAGVWIAIPADTHLLVPVFVTLALGLVGLMDDRHQLSLIVRLLAQFAAVIAILVYFVFFQDLISFLDPIGPFWVLFPLLVLWGVLWINLFNFMDGIDGLAVSQAIFVVGSLLVFSSGFQFWDFTGHWLWLACIVVSGTVFLFFNRSPAKIFMGDAGSYFFAIVILLAALWGLVSEQVSPFASFILIAVFVADAGVALVRRILTGRNWAAGHRTHAYQYLSRRLSHTKTTLIYTMLNIFWVLPLAFCAQRLLVNPFLCVVFAYVPLVIFVVWGKSGQPETS